MARRGIRIKRMDVEEPTVNLTALIDVVFSILIMFIVIAPMLDIEKVELADAGVREGVVSATEGAEVMIHVHEDNSVWLNKKVVELSALKDLLMEEKALHPKAKPQLFHDKRAHFGTYQAVKNAAEGAGFEELDIVLKPS